MSVNGMNEQSCVETVSHQLWDEENITLQFPSLSLSFLASWLPYTASSTCLQVHENQKARIWWHKESQKTSYTTSNASLNEVDWCRFVFWISVVFKPTDWALVAASLCKCTFDQELSVLKRFGQKRSPMMGSLDHTSWLEQNYDTLHSPGRLSCCVKSWSWIETLHRYSHWNTFPWSQIQPAAACTRTRSKLFRMK